MRKMLIAAALLSAASVTTIALAQTKPLDPDGMYDPAITTQQTMEPSAPMIAPAGGPSVVPDARAMASDQEVGEARRAYRASCNSSGENAGFCDCVTAGVAQVLMPSEVRIAARTFGDRIPAQGDSYAAAQSDMTPVGASSAERIEQVEAHYADACSQFR
jgi:hypothetical protein